jgi:hypothetical protein
MGSVSLAIGNAAREAGAHIVTCAEVFMPRNELGLVQKLQFSKFVQWFAFVRYAVV